VFFAEECSNSKTANVRKLKVVLFRLSTDGMETLLAILFIASNTSTSLLFANTTYLLFMLCWDVFDSNYICKIGYIQ